MGTGTQDCTEAMPSVRSGPEPDTAHSDELMNLAVGKIERSDSRAGGRRTAPRPVARVRVRALMALAMLAAAGLLVGACSVAAPGPVITEGDPPGRPELSHTYIETATGIEVSWAAPAPEPAVTGYDVRWRPFSEESWSTATGLGSSTTSYSIADLAPEVEYLIQVRASSSVGSGDWSEPLVYDPEKNSLFRAVSVAADAADAGDAISATRAEGTDGDDYIYIEWGNEYYDLDYHILGLGGDDRIRTGSGNDHLDGGGGSDSLDGNEKAMTR